jgi:hypothetical protein
MLLTIPWYLAILGGRVHIINGAPSYRKPKLEDNSMSLTGTGVSVGKKIRTNGLLMIASCALYLVIQIPVIMTDKSGYSKDPAKRFDEEADGVSAVCKR